MKAKERKEILNGILDKVIDELCEQVDFHLNQEKFMVDIRIEEGSEESGNYLELNTGGCAYLTWYYESGDYYSPSYSYGQDGSGTIDYLDIYCIKDGETIEFTHDELRIFWGCIEQAFDSFMKNYEYI